MFGNLSKNIWSRIVSSLPNKRCVNEAAIFDQFVDKMSLNTSPLHSVLYIPRNCRLGMSNLLILELNWSMWSVCNDGSSYGSWHEQGSQVASKPLLAASPKNLDGFPPGVVPISQIDSALVLIPIYLQLITCDLWILVSFDHVIIVYSLFGYNY
jgi:hypothetical protein